MDDRSGGGRTRTEAQTLDQFHGLDLSLPMTMTTSYNDTARVGAEYGVSSFPTFFVIGQSGEVESVHVGSSSKLGKKVGKELDVLLGGQNRAAFSK